jgi:hypothetical protein
MRGEKDEGREEGMKARPLPAPPRPAFDMRLSRSQQMGALALLLLLAVLVVFRSC